MEHIIQTWEIHQRINLYLLDAINEADLESVSASGGRNAGSQFAHIHNVRLMWLQASKPELLEGLVKIEKESATSKEILKSGLEKSSMAIALLLKETLLNGKIKGFKPHPTAFLGYLISHESHHRGQIMMTLKQAGHPLDKKTQFGLWEWGSR